MPDPRKPVFDAVKTIAGGNPFNQRSNITLLHRALDEAGCPKQVAIPKKGKSGLALTPRGVLELLEHEGVVLEAYKDVVGVWTWGVGVTSRSGHKVMRYKDNPSTMEDALRVYLWLLRDKYLPGVLKAFGNHPLSENELSAALSFHYNTGAIHRARWVKLHLAGRRAEARAAIMNWRKPAAILSRRKAERDLFFDGRWSSDGIVPVYSVSKPSYKPARARLIDITSELNTLLIARGST